MAEKRSEGEASGSTRGEAGEAAPDPEDLYPHDRELMRRLTKGDAEAFEPFVHRHADAVFRLTRFMTADALTARRVAVEAFAEAFRTFYPEKGGRTEAAENGELVGLPAECGGDLGAWMLSTARRLALAEPPIPPPSREIDLTGGAEDPAAFRKVRELEIDLREAIVLRHSEGDDKLGYETIGRACGISPETAAERLAGARHDLARVLGGLSEEAPEEPRPAGSAEGPGRLATGTGIDLYVILSRHIDGALPPERASEVERQLKQSSRCREEIAALRGADRLAAHAVEGVRDPGLVPAVMEALGLRSRAVPMGGRRFPRSVLWGLIALAALSAGALVAAGFQALLGGEEKEHRILGFRVGGEEGARPEWRVREPGKGATAEVSPGSRVSTGTELDLPAPGAHGTLARPDGLCLHAERGVRLTIADDATDERGFVLVGGRVLVDLPEGAGPFELAAGGTRLSFDSPPARVLINQGADEPSVCVLAGSARFACQNGEFVLDEGKSLSFGSGLPSVPILTRDPDLRRFALDFIPPRLRPSAWPVKGGSVARSGSSPFRFTGPPELKATLDGVAGASAVVLAPDGTGYFLAGPPPGRLVGVDGVTGRRVAASAPFAYPRTGDPALGPDGRIYVSTRDGAVSAFLPGSAALEAVTVVPPSPGDLPRTGPTVGPDGSVYVVYARELAAYSPEGAPRWRRKDIDARTPPSIGPDGAVFAASLGGRLYALDAATGRDLGGGEISVGDAFLSHVAVGLDGTAYALSAGGKLVWYAPDGRDEQGSGRRGAGGASGEVALPESDFPLAPAVTGDGEVVVASSTGTVYRLPGRPTEPPEAPFFEAGESLSQGPLVDGAGRVLLITKSGAFVTIDPTGRSRTVELDARWASPPAIARDGAVIFVTRDGRVFAGGRR